MFNEDGMTEEAKRQLEQKDFEKIEDGFSTAQEKIHDNAVKKGFWDELKDYTGIEWTYEQRTLEVQERVNVGEKLALIHSEISEALEAARDDILKPDKHCPKFTNFEIELADAIIRCLDTGAGFGFDLGAAVVAKMKFNATRPRKHGKRF